MSLEIVSSSPKLLPLSSLFEKEEPVLSKKELFSLKETYSVNPAYKNPLNGPLVKQPFIGLQRYISQCIHEKPLSTIISTLVFFALTQALAQAYQRRHSLHSSRPFKILKVSFPTYAKRISAIITIGIFVQVFYQWRRLLIYVVNNVAPNIFRMKQAPKPCNGIPIIERQFFKDSNLIGELKYQSQENGHDYPVLKLWPSTYEEIGFTKTMLTVEKVYKSFHHTLKIMIKLIQFEAGDLEGKRFTNAIKNIYILESDYQEMLGIYKAFQFHAFLTNRKCAFRNLKDVYRLHMLVDVYKRALYKLDSPLGCSYVCTGGAWGRSMEWPSINYFFQYLEKVYYTNKTIETVNFSAYVGMSTGSNESLDVIANECGYASVSDDDSVYDFKSKKLIVYPVFIKMLMKHSKSIEEAHHFVKTNEARPASSFTMILTNKKGNKKGDIRVYHFNVVKGKEYIFNDFNCHDDIIITNHALDKDKKPIPDTDAARNSFRRAKRMNKILDTSKSNLDSPEETVIKTLQEVSANRHSVLSRLTTAKGNDFYGLAGQLANSLHNADGYSTSETKKNNV